jgi:hypothetical protein
MRAVVCYSVRLRKSDRERVRDLSRDAQILPKTAKRKSANEEGLLLFYEKFVPRINSGPLISI